MNVPPKIAMVLSRAPQLLPALETTVGLEGLEDIVEVMMIDARNERIIADAQEREAEEGR